MNLTSDKYARAGDDENGTQSAGPFSFVWANGDDYFEGIGNQDPDRTAEPVNKVGRGGLMAADEDESR